MEQERLAWFTVIVPLGNRTKMVEDAKAGIEKELAKLGIDLKAEESSYFSLRLASQTKDRSQFAYELVYEVSLTASPGQFQNIMRSPSGFAYRRAKHNSQALTDSEKNILTTIKDVFIEVFDVKWEEVRGTGKKGRVAYVRRLITLVAADIGRVPNKAIGFFLNMAQNSVSTTLHVARQLLRSEDGRIIRDLRSTVPLIVNDLELLPSDYCPGHDPSYSNCLRLVAECD